MFLKNIHLQNFRNYDYLDLELANGINVFYGNNGQGKTNLLESIHVLALTKSHRSFIDQNLLKKNCSFSIIKGDLMIDDFQTELEILLQKTQKRLKIDGDEIKRVGEYISTLNIIIFYPEDLEFIKSSPIVRRRFLNTELSQLQPNYIEIVNQYNKVVKMRNNYLKTVDKVDLAYFKVLTNYLIDSAIMIYRMRYKFLCNLSKIASIIYEDIMELSGLEIRYKPNVCFENYEKDYIRKILEEKFQVIQENEIRFKNTLIGPHKDDIEIYLGDLNIKNYGSQGQQRMTILAIKLAEIEIFQKYKGTTPILLLDDVFSELDEKRKNNLLTYITGKIQTIITTTDLEKIDASVLKEAKIFNIHQAMVEER